MKKNLLLILVLGTVNFSIAQDNLTKTMEKRTREFHRVLSLEDKAEWKKYVQENYSQALIDKPIRAVKNTGDGSTESSTSSKPADNVEAKVSMFEMLHSDFGNSSLLSLKTEGEKAIMVLQNGDGLLGTFTLTFDKQAPYLIAGIGVEAGM